MIQVSLQTSWLLHAEAAVPARTPKRDCTTTGNTEFTNHGDFDYALRAFVFNLSIA
jgi:hypothetical protein